jgi:hypothetical protein
MTFQQFSGGIQYVDHMLSVVFLREDHMLSVSLALLIPMAKVVRYVDTQKLLREEFSP